MIQLPNCATTYHCNVSNCINYNPQCKATAEYSIELSLPINTCSYNPTHDHDNYL